PGRASPHRHRGQPAVRRAVADRRHPADPAPADQAGRGPSGPAGGPGAGAGPAPGGTHTCTDPGWTLIRSLRTGARSPPSGPYGTGLRKRTLIWRPRVSRTNGDRSGRLAAIRAKTRAQSAGFLAVTTPKSSIPSSGSAAGNMVSPPNARPTFPA